MKKEYINNILALFCSFALVILVLWPMIKAPYGFEEEYKFTKIGNPDIEYFGRYESSKTYQNPIEYIEMYHDLGRSRSYTRLLPWAIASGTDGNPLWIRLWMISAAALTLFLFYLLLRKLKLSVIVSSFLSLLFFTGNYNEVWIKAGLGETPGILFLIMGLYFLVSAIESGRKSYMIAGVATIVLSAMSKESFIPVVPFASIFLAALISINSNIPFKEAFKRHISVHLILGVVFLLLTVDVITALGAGINMRQGSALINGTVFFSNLLTIIYVPVFLISAVAFVILKGDSSSQRAKIVYGTSLFLIITQLIIYKSVTISSFSRYLIPAQLPLFIISGFLIMDIIKRSARYITFITIAIMAALIIYGAKNNLINSSYYSARCSAFSEIPKTLLERNVKKVAVIIDDSSTFEFVSALATEASNVGCNPEIRFLNFKTTADPDSIYNYGLEKEFILSGNELIEEQWADCIVQASVIQNSDYSEFLANRGYENFHVIRRKYFNFGLSRFYSKDTLQDEVSYKIFCLNKNY